MGLFVPMCIGIGTPDLAEILRSWRKCAPRVVMPHPVPRPHQIFIAELVITQRVSTSNTADGYLEQNNEQFRCLVRPPSLPVLIVCFEFLNKVWLFDDHSMGYWFSLKVWCQSPDLGEHYRDHCGERVKLSSRVAMSHYHESLSPKHHRKLRVRRHRSVT